MPALVKSKVGSLWGTTDEEGTANNWVSKALMHTCLKETIVDSSKSYIQRTCGPPGEIIEGLAESRAPILANYRASAAINGNWTD